MAVFEEITRGRRGLSCSLDPKDVGGFRSALTIPAGIVVVPGTTEGSCKAPTTAAEVAKALGVVMYSPTEQPDTATGNEYRAKSMCDVQTMGHIWCTVEGTVVKDAQPFVRFSGANPGQLLASSGPAGIVVTPTAVNSTRYYMTVRVQDGSGTYTFPVEFTSDASATAAEVAIGLAAVLDADPNIVAVESAGTLVLTSTTAFLSVIEVDANLAITSDGQIAAPLPSSLFRMSLTGAGIAKVELKVL